MTQKGNQRKKKFLEQEGNVSKAIEMKRQYFLNVSHFIINFHLKKKLDFLIPPTFPKYPYNAQGVQKE